MLNLLWDIFAAMARVGIFGYGGGPSVIPLIQKEAVGAKWMTPDEFAAALAMGNALPGPIATKMSAYIGYTVLMEATNNSIIALAGAISAVLGMVVPSFIMMLILGIGFLQFKDYPQVKGALQAVKPVIVGLLAYTAWTVMPQPLRMDAVWIAVLSFLLLVTWDVHPVFLILAATVFGAVVYAR
jgi:chromate transporter